MRSALWCWFIVLLPIVDRHSLKVTDGIRPAQFAQALDGEEAFIYLRNGRLLRARALQVESDSVRYMQELTHPILHDPMPQVMGAVPTASVKYIDVTRPRKAERVRRNLAGGTGVGLGVGSVLYTGVALSVRQQADTCGDGCFGLAIAAGLSKFLMPAGAILGFGVGAAANAPRPRDRYYPFVESDGRIWFRKVER